MKSKYKISIIVIVIIVGIYIVLPPTWTVILCDDQFLGLDACGDYLQEKYSKLPIVEYFVSAYPDPGDLSFTSDKFKVVSVSASSILTNKIFVFLEINLDDLTVTYTCQNHNLGKDYLVMEIINPTIEDLNDNNCRILNPLDGN